MFHDSQFRTAVLLWLSRKFWFVPIVLLYVCLVALGIVPDNIRCHKYGCFIKSDGSVTVPQFFSDKPDHNDPFWFLP